MAELIAKRALANAECLAQGGLSARPEQALRAYRVEGAEPEGAIPMEPDVWLVLSGAEPVGAEDVTSGYAVWRLEGAEWPRWLDVAPLATSGRGFTARVASLRAHVLPLENGALLAVERPHGPWLHSWLAQRLMRIVA